MSAAIDTSEVVDALERSPRILIPLVLGIPLEKRKTRPAPGKWSAHEHAVHLAEVHPLFYERLDRMLAQNRPAIKPYNPVEEHSDDALLALDLDEALSRFQRDRAALVERLRRLAPDQWQREAVHPEYSTYTVAVMFRHLALHDFLHGYRIEELALNPNA